MSFVIQQHQQRIFGLSDLAHHFGSAAAKKESITQSSYSSWDRGGKSLVPWKNGSSLLLRSSHLLTGESRFCPLFPCLPPSAVASGFRERESRGGGGAGQLFNYMLLSAGGRGIALPQTRRTKYSWQPSRDKGRRFSERKAEWAEGGRVE